MDTKIIGVFKERGETINLSKEHVERALKTILNFDIKLKVVPVNTPVYADVE